MHLFYCLLLILAISNLCADFIPEGRLALRHIEAKGIGYNKGYTSLDLFLIHPESFQWHSVSFLDLRGHLFNDGRTAANLGVGFRHIDCYRRIWGINGYYDYRHTHKTHYNQIGLGLESLGENFDVRVNAYVPVWRKSKPYGKTRFDHFQGHHLYIFNKKEVTFWGLNAELGTGMSQLGLFDYYVAAGPYYYSRQHKHVWGGEIRMSMRVWDHLAIDLKTSYDNQFNYIFQGQMSLIIPFGRHPGHACPEFGCYCYADHLRERALQRVQRHEIIVTDKIRSKHKAINPVTEKPYYFIFVDREGYKGTYGSPFRDLAQASEHSSPHDIIYVFNADGSIALKEGQSLLGGGIAQEIATTRGIILTPSYGDHLPTLSSASLQYGQNRISGLDFKDGIQIRGGNSYVIENNTFHGTGLTLHAGEDLKVQNNLFFDANNVFIK